MRGIKEENIVAEVYRSTDSDAYSIEVLYFDQVENEAFLDAVGGPDSKYAKLVNGKFVRGENYIIPFADEIKASLWLEEARKDSDAKVYDGPQKLWSPNLTK